MRLKKSYLAIFFSFVLAVFVACGPTAASDEESSSDTNTSEEEEKDNLSSSSSVLDWYASDREEAYKELGEYVEALEDSFDLNSDLCDADCEKAFEAFSSAVNDL